MIAYWPDVFLPFLLFSVALLDAVKLTWPAPALDNHAIKTSRKVIGYSDRNCTTI